MISEMYKLCRQSIKSTNKYLIDWQIARLSMKNLKINEKLAILKGYFLIDKSLPKFYRVLNYIQACNISQGIEDNKNVTAFLAWCRESVLTNIENSKNSFEEYDASLLRKLYKDLTSRNDKWVKGGYFHGLQIQFLKDLANHLGIEYEQADTENFDYKFKF